MKSVVYCCPACGQDTQIIGFSSVILEGQEICNKCAEFYGDEDSALWDAISFLGE